MQQNDVAISTANAEGCQWNRGLIADRFSKIRTLLTYRCADNQTVGTKTASCITLVIIHTKASAPCKTRHGPKGAAWARPNPAELLYPAQVMRATNSWLWLPVWLSPLTDFATRPSKPLYTTFAHAKRPLISRCLTQSINVEPTKRILRSFVFAESKSPDVFWKSLSLHPPLQDDVTRYVGLVQMSTARSEHALIPACSSFCVMHVNKLE